MPEEKERSKASVDAIEKQVRQLKWIKQQRDSLDVMEEEAQRIIKEALGENEIGMVGGKPAVSWIKSWPNRFDSKRFRADHPDMWDQYKQPPKEPVRTFKLVEDQ